MTRTPRGAAGQPLSSPDPASGATEAFTFAPTMVTLTAPRGRQASAIRSLAGELDVLHLAAGHRGLAVCGVSRAVGVSFMAANLAVALSERGRSVLLVDANLQHSGLDRLIQPPGAPLGLRDVLADPALRLHEVVCEDVLPSLSIVYAGHASERSHQELLGSDALRRTLEAAMRDYDLTLVDTSAANLSADARRVATVVGHALIVARRDQSFADDLTTFTRELRQDGVAVVGTVFNAA